MEIKGWTQIMLELMNFSLLVIAEVAFAGFMRSKSRLGWFFWLLFPLSEELLQLSLSLRMTNGFSPELSFANGKAIFGVGFGGERLNAPSFPIFFPEDFQSLLRNPSSRLDFGWVSVRVIFLSPSRSFLEDFGWSPEDFPNKCLLLFAFLSIGMGLVSRLPDGFSLVFVVSMLLQVLFVVFWNQVFISLQHRLKFLIRTFL
mmetsp:Transcript_28705/g.32805  ORF Transcript_28705/g.32805 Transcript_28705/m.32805 type:complete len:201 (-) Transcript_28705:112-714(-)